LFLGFLCFLYFLLQKYVCKELKILCSNSENIRFAEPAYR
jgi:hypothetical protein